nr:hypothetical protein [Tanacetum cinerariifolium]
MESKNDTTIAVVDVLMKNETIVDDVQMENTSNQDDGKAVDNVVSNHGKAVNMLLVISFNLSHRHKFSLSQTRSPRGIAVETRFLSETAATIST